MRMQTCFLFWAFVFVFVFLVYFVALGDTSRTSGGRGETDFCLGRETNQRTTKGRGMVGTRWEAPAESWAGGGGPKGPSRFHCCHSGLTVFLCHLLSKFGRMFCGTMDRVLSQGG